MLCLFGVVVISSALITKRPAAESAGRLIASQTPFVCMMQLEMELTNHGQPSSCYLHSLRQKLVVLARLPALTAAKELSGVDVSIGAQKEHP